MIVDWALNSRIRWALNSRIRPPREGRFLIVTKSGWMDIWAYVGNGDWREFDGVGAHYYEPPYAWAELPVFQLATRELTETARFAHQQEELLR